MKFGVLGTGSVGQTISTKLVEIGHSVFMGSRDENNQKAAAWVRQKGAGLGQSGTFESAAAFGDIIVNATNGMASLDALKAAGADNLDGKILIDVANPLIPTAKGVTLGYSGETSLGEEIQKAFPQARVVKALNTANASVMVNPDALKGEHDLFIAGDDYQAKTQVTEILNSFGWKRNRILDLGDISAARGTESYLLLWIRMHQAIGSPEFNISITRLP